VYFRPLKSRLLQQKPASKVWAGVWAGRIAYTEICMSKLTVRAIEKLTRAGSKSLTSDGNGLYFKVGATGGTSWIFRYKFNKSSTDMGLGGYP
jgi:hypothetical protein